MVMSVITAAIFITLGKKTWTMMQKGMCVMKILTVMILVSIIIIIIIIIIMCVCFPSPADNTNDNCPNISNRDQADFDNDTVGDVCDNCRYINNTDQENTDSDRRGDKCDEDDDNDGHGK